MIENIPHLVKYTTPTKYDIAPYATAWVISLDGLKDRLWLQTSQDMDRMDWVEMPELLGCVFEQFYSNKHFIEECLLMLKDKREDKREVKEIKFVR